MNYEKKYKEALERAKEIIECSKSDTKEVRMVLSFFPELADSKDEKVKKSLIRLVKSFYDVNFPTPEGFTKEQLLSWLEKQGEKDEEIIILKDKIESLEAARIAIQELHKPAEWSEEDKKMLDTVIEDIVKLAGPYVCYHKDVDWLKSLKDRVQPKQEWSYDDVRQYKAAIAICNSLGHTNTANWLKSLRPQSTWKPSDEHYELEEFAKIVRGNLTGISKAVQKLFEAKYLQLTGNKMYVGFKD